MWSNNHHLSPKSIWWIISVVLLELADGVIYGAADLVTDLSQLLTEGKLPFTLVPVIVPLSTIFAPFVPVPSWEENIFEDGFMFLCVSLTSDAEDLR